MRQKISYTPKPSILVVDDTPENLRYLNELLSSKGYDVRATLDGKMALEVAERIHPDLILLDIQMPEMDGYMVSEALRKNKILRDIPIIFISALTDVEDKIKAFEAGGVDYITKPFEEKEVLARVDVHLQLHQSKIQVEALLQQQDYFTKKIMHEMNTPVSVIRLNAQSLELQIGKNPHIDTIKASAKILSSIYDDLGYLIKKELYPHEPEKIKLLEFLSSRISYFHEIAEVKNIELNLEVNMEYRVFMNANELERLVDNTLSNAIKYSNENTQIEIFIGYEADKYILSFTDEGMGIEDTDAIFEDYYQGAPTNSGLGIGMATVKGVCEKYGITVNVKSEKGKGSTFTYSFEKKMVHSL